MDETVPNNIEITLDLGITMNFILNIRDQVVSGKLLKNIPNDDSNSHKTAVKEKLLQPVSESELTADNNPKNNTKKRWWTKYETTSLINSVKFHAPELKYHDKNLWINVKSDLELLKIKVTVKECMIKWKNLVRSYVSVKKLKEKNSDASSRFKYFDDIHAIMCLIDPKTPKVIFPKRVQRSKSEGGLGLGLTQDFLKFKQEEWNRKQQEWEKRHKEKEILIELQKRRLDIEERKLNLIESFIKIKNKENSDNL